MTLSRKVIPEGADIAEVESRLVSCGFTVIQVVHDLVNHTVLLLYVTETLSRAPRIPENFS